MAEPSAPQRPDDHLAAIIAEALSGAGLVPAAKTAEVRRKLASGTARESDWRLWIGASLAREPLEDADAQAD